MELFDCAPLGKTCRANMVNKTFLPPALRPRKTAKRFKSLNFPDWHDIRSEHTGPHGLGRALGGFDGVGGRAWESRSRDTDQRGAPPMENTLLVGLSRRGVLEGRLDVFLNNSPQENTQGSK